MRNVVLWASVIVLSASPIVFGQGAGTTTGPNVIVGDLPSVQSYGSVGAIAAFSVGTTSCNIGDQSVSWVASTNQHPVIGQNMYRLKGGVMEQIGQSWLKHGFAALSGSVCGTCMGPGGSQLSPGCSDPYGAGLNGNQSGLGPRSQVNPTTTFFPYPWSAPSAPATIGRRLQVMHSDLSSSLNPGAQYFVTGHYIAPGEQAFPGNDDNNSSWRPITVSPSGASYNISLTGSTTRQETALDAWQNFNPDVQLQDVHVDGYIQLATRVIDLGGGMWQYEYALYNMNSDRAVRGWTVNLNPGTTVTSTGFHAVFSHSGEPYSNSAWTPTVSASQVQWQTDSFATDPNANAIHWDTQYNFRFVALSEPVTGTATIEMFKPGTPTTVTVNVPVPLGNGVPAVTDLTCDQVGTGVQLGWMNADTYSAIEITRDGSLIATLSGSATSYLDDPVAVGPHTYGVTAFSGGDGSFSPTCAVDVTPPPIEFEIEAADATISYNPTTGVGSGTMTLRVNELPSSPGAPNPVSGWSMAASFDSSLVTPTSFDATPDTSSVSFFQGSIWADGITVGVIVDFMGGFLSALPSLDAAIVHFDSNASTMAGDVDGETTAITFVDGVYGNPGAELDNIVTVGVEAYFPILNDGVITLIPGSAEVFVRGDTNDDGQVNIADAVFVLDELFSGGPASVCDDASDVNDDGGRDIADAVFALSYLFSGGPAPAAPFPSCGPDGTDTDSLDCASFSSCP
ncbi:MAG: dockerin type I repeat-containing protein [Planctomycetes bacterium]|nr:dockerin type I repeat-containing protein [Planctomycetota bacterium]